MGADDTRQALLLAALEVAVPLWIERWRAQPWDRIRVRAQECASAIASHGDAVLFRVSTPRRKVASAGKTAIPAKTGMGTAEAFNHLAEGLALLSFGPGGVTFLGRHWETADLVEGALFVPLAFGDFLGDLLSPVAALVAWISPWW